MRSLPTQPYPALCIPASGHTAAELRRSVEAALLLTDLVELRLDMLADPAAGLNTLSPWIQSLISQRQITLLATCRPQRSGGHFTGNASAETAMLLQAARAGCALVDLSLESAEALGATEATNILMRLRGAGAQVMISFHDFACSPDLQAVLRRCAVFSADLYKVVSTAHSLSDSLDLLRLLNGVASPKPLVAISMGEDGLPTRVLGPQKGSAFTFAAGTPDQATAPGQLTAATMQELYRVGQHTTKTAVYAVAGDPIRSSLSPLMLNTAFLSAGVDAVYVPLRTSDPLELMRAARELPLEGFSVTMPLKQHILAHLDLIDPLAAKIGAVNTVRRLSDGRLEGHNTDAAGIVEPLAARLDLRGARVLVLGAGGAARAAVFGCLSRGAQVFIANRTYAAAAALAADSGARAVDLDEIGALQIDALVQATPAGMHGNAVKCPLTAEQLRAQIVFDLVYNPLHTPLLQLAEHMGKTTIPGVEMFVHQGAKQFELWTGTAAPLAVMSRAVRDALEERTRAYV